LVAGELPLASASPRSAASSTLASAGEPLRDTGLYEKVGAAGRAVDSSDPTSLYRVGVGDILDIRVANSEGISPTLHTVPVLASGLVEYSSAVTPFAVSGMTTEEVARRLESELHRRAAGERSQVTVNVREYASHTIIVSGLVGDPGTKVLRREAVPLYVVIAEAQARPESGRVLIRSHATGQASTVDLADVAAMNQLVRPGDVIIVAALPQQFYFISGHVIAPGQKEFHAGMTLTQSILAAGGELHSTPSARLAWINRIVTAGVVSSSDRRSVSVARQGADGRLVTVTYYLQEMLSGKVPDPPLQPGDRIEVRR